MVDESTRVTLLLSSPSGIPAITPAIGGPLSIKYQENISNRLSKNYPLTLYLVRVNP